MVLKRVAGQRSRIGQWNSLRSVVLCTCVLIVGIATLAGIALGHPGASHGGQGVAGAQTNATAGPTEPVCPADHPEWRRSQTIAGVSVQADPSCQPDNPYVVAASVKGTNNVPDSVLMRSGLAPDAVTKHTDRDGDGDPDVIHITIEIAGINEVNESDVTHEIAPGIDPAFWAFMPKARGMMDADTDASRLARMPSPPIRVEQGDQVKVTVENTHHQPHTVHFHGVDHPYESDGRGNDGVPQTSERPILPGEKRTYEFSPRSPGTMFYHCHVVPDVHVVMGLNGMFVVEKDRPNNTVQTFNVGAGRVRHPSAGIRSNYSAEYDMHYQGVDAELHQIPKEFDDPRRVAREMNRRYDPTEATRDYFLVNGRSFPYTVRESQVIVEPAQKYRLRVLNGGSETVSLHTHGHKVTIEAYDGVEVAERQEITRDVVGLTAAQRLDLTLNTTDDGRHAYGPGIWLVHDHREKAVTNDGISPGGTVSMITYRSYLDANGIPKTNVDLQRYFSEAFYEGKTPMFSNLDGTRFGPVAVGSPTGNQSTSGQQPATNESGTDRTTILGIPVIFLAVGVLGIAFAVQLAVLYSERRDEQ